MQIDKNQILELLRNQGDDAKAQQADQELPGTVDTDQHAGILTPASWSSWASHPWT
jgi:hypothetical protein